MFSICDTCGVFFIMTSCILTLHAYFIRLTISKTEGIYLCSVLQIMASIRRNTIRVNFVQIPAQLRELVYKVPDTSLFVRRHGHLLSWVTIGFDEGLMSVLFKFFDPKHHCFTFPDYQLVPTLEEFSKILGSPILE